MFVDFSHLLKQKGYYPYSYMSNRSKFADQELQPLEMWKNTLDYGKISISSQELERAKLMWERFECRTMQDYHDCYLKLDVALLACCSVFCQKLRYHTYRLDLAQFFTALIMAKDAALRINKARVELMTEPEPLHMIEPSVRGGMTSVFETRYFKANNRFWPGFKSKESHTFGFSVDAKKLYGDVIQAEFLPWATSDCKWSIDQINTENSHKFDHWVLRWGGHSIPGKHSRPT